MSSDKDTVKVLISGAGIVGLVFALALKKHVGITPELFERATEFHDDVGAALGMYPNALRVLRDIDPDLLYNLKAMGAPYVYRRFERHDGTEVATANEDILHAGDGELQSFGIRRWRLQKVLYNAVVEAGIPVHFGKATNGVIEHEDGKIEVLFSDGTSRYTELLIGADGGKSAVRSIVATGESKLHYTGVTCLMGISDCPSPRVGISFPSSFNTNFHACYFPTGEDEQCFQIHLPVDESEADKTNWGNLSKADGIEEFEILARQMETDGWHPRYIEPLRRVEHAVKVGFALLEPQLTQWVYGKTGRIFLVGDAAHPPVPYVGQGAQMGIEDAGTLCLLLKNLCSDGKGNLEFQYLADAARMYETIRIPRTHQILECSKSLGDRHSTRSKGEAEAAMEELMLAGEVMMNDNLPIMFPGATYNYNKDVMKAIFAEKAQIADREYFSDLMDEGEKLFEEYEQFAGYH
eukprot:Nitzschia sp. Nitz4//scaffold105_size73764//49936//51408//NITZ4_005679-RA/size73764-processed-gene-0.96-mRNA-1//-1//CDS//3329532456//8358//frame0